MSSTVQIEGQTRNFLVDLVERYPILKIATLSMLFAMLVLVVRAYGLENKAFVVMLIVACVFFPVHHYVPARYKLPLFVCVSFIAICTSIGLLNGLWLVSLGSVFLLLAHAPIKFSYRVALIALYFLCLAVFRAEVLPAKIPGAIWPILGSMFMFRMIIYMYELKNKTSEFSVSRALAYFFMMPNANFTLLPVIDYKNLYAVYYPKNVQPVEIYEKGISLLLKGTIHLLLYRLVYQNVLIDPAVVSSASDATQYLVGTFLLYLRISGYFHMISGILHMYGFNLPETHHLYFLASSFTDFWRRINIFWKDFMQKIFFYPVQFYLTRQGGKYRAVILATVATFFVTWFLHAYQWFWIRGEVKFSLQDALFWGTLGVVVLVNMLLEMRFPKKKSLKKKKQSVVEQLVLAVKTILTFSCIVVIWNVWSTPDFAELKRVFQSYANFAFKDFLFVGAIVLCIGLLAIFYGHRQRGDSNPFRISKSKSDNETRFQRNSAVAFFTLLLMLFVNYFPGTLPLPVSVGAVVQRVTSPVLNERDRSLLQRGYYEDLTNVSRFSPELQVLFGNKPAGWTDSTVHVKEPDKFPSLRFLPSSTGTFKNSVLETNSFGFRDQEYSKAPGPNIYRIGLVGASHSLGSGVNNHEVYEALVEDRINKNFTDERQDHRVEIINMSMGGNGAAYKIATAEKRGLELGLDAILYIAIDDYKRIPIEIARHLTKEENEFFFTEISQYVEGLGVKPGTDRKVAELIVADHLPQLTEMYYRYLRDLARENSVDLWFGFIPVPVEPSNRVEKNVQSQIALARDMGIRTFDVRQAYKDVPVLPGIWIAPWDRHPNAMGHELLSDRVYEELWPLILNAVENKKL